mmetsp:Transcript_21442/g.67612  ORF Transcript_21442/g.67612 Transcript_21442/m.67612 type:complete len:476 (+) Transcript_21442:46-1473(+)
MVAGARAVDAVVEVHAAHAVPNFLHPYQKAVPEFSRSTAFVVSGQLLMTNAHCVAFATHVQVKRRDQDVRFTAEVVCIGYECDLALLAVNKEAFWKGLGGPIEFSQELPWFGEAVVVLGFGRGGDNLCTTQGVVSRVDVQPYPWAKGQGYQFVQLPVVQIDAAINPGNSGGPALAGGQAIGVAFMGMEEAQSVGFIIPAKVALHFLEDFRLHGEFTNFGYPPFRWQSLETEDMRSYFDVTGRGGVRVTSVDPNIDSGLKPDDVVLELFGEPVGFDGKVAVPLGGGEVERVSLWYLFCDKFTRTTCPCLVRRGSEDLQLSFELQPVRPIVPVDPAVPNEFLIVAGLVLQPMTMGYLADAEAWYSYEVQRTLHGSWDSATADRQVVIITGVLSHEVNAGMAFAREDALESINGERVRSLRHAASLVDGCSNEWLILCFASKAMLAVRAEAARRSTRELLERHDLHSDRFLQPLPSKL